LAIWPALRLATNFCSRRFSASCYGVGRNFSNTSGVSCGRMKCLPPNPLSAIVRNIRSHRSHPEFWRLPWFGAFSQIKENKGKSPLGQQRRHRIAGNPAASPFRTPGIEWTIDPQKKKKNPCTPRRAQNRSHIRRGPDHRVHSR
jgi:hypothetical protein